jgi:peptidyl-prolyl cis-trans isomerase C
MSYPFHRLGPSIAMLVCAALMPGVASAQSGTKPGISPISPPTLKAPVFDTTTPVYNVPNVTKADSSLVAEVDGVPITLGELADAIKELPDSMQNLPYDQLFSIVQNRLIVRRALVIRARQKGLDEDPEIRRRMTTAADQVLANEYVRREASKGITEQDLLARYAKTVAGQPGPEEVHLRVIMVPTEADANDVVKRLKAGTDFAAEAQRISKDATASVGGDLGYVTRAGLTPEVSAAAFLLSPGQLTPAPVLSNGSWFVLKVDDRRRQPAPDFSTVRAQLLDDMMRERLGDVGTRAISGTTVRKFTIGGKEIEGLPSDRNQ